MVSPDSRTRLGDLQGSLLYVTVFAEASCILLSIIWREHLVLFMFVLLFCDVMLGTLMKIDGICICDYFTCLLWYYFTCLLWYYFTCLLWYYFTCLLWYYFTCSGLPIFFQNYQYFIIYRQYFLLNFEQFSWISYATLFKIRRYQRPFRQVKVPGTAPYWKACMFIVILLHMFIVSCW
jgi:hypothetical protein